MQPAEIGLLAPYRPDYLNDLHDWLMSLAGQSIGGKADSLQGPANKTFKSDPHIPSMDSVRLIKYEFEK